MPHINDRYKLIHNRILHKLRQISIHQSVDMNYEINPEWIEMISNDLNKVANVSYILYIGKQMQHVFATPITDENTTYSYRLYNIAETDLSSAVARVFTQNIINFDKSEFRALSLDALGV